MPVSSYQVERLIDRLRRLGGWRPWPAYRRWRGADPVQVSRAARAAGPEAGPEAGPATSPRPVPPLAAVRDGRRFPPVVEQERERRAGSFMEPPYLHGPPPEPIPRLGRTAPRPRRRAVAEGD